MTMDSCDWHCNNQLTLGYDMGCGARQ